jgi:hypothetical protein
VSDRVTGLQYDWSKASLRDMRGRGQTNWACSDDGDCLNLTHDILRFN